MGLKVSLDTNVFLGVKNREHQYESSKKILDWIDSGELKCAISTVVLAEMCSGYHAAGELDEKEDFLTHLITSQNYDIVELSATLADDAGAVKTATKLRLPDSIVVASAVREKAESLISNDLSLKMAEKLVRVLTAREFVDERESKRKG